MTRAYHSPTREAQTSATRRRVSSAAQECFEERGYVATTTRAIAQRAQVSVADRGLSLGLVCDGRAGGAWEELDLPS